MNEQPDYPWPEFVQREPDDRADRRLRLYRRGAWVLVTFSVLVLAGATYIMLTGRP